MDNNNAYEYENFITSVHQCFRFEVLWADADIFKWLEQFDVLLQEEIRKQGALNYRNIEIERLEFQLGRETGEVSTHLIIAIEMILIQYEKNLSYQDKELLMDMKKSLKTAEINDITCMLKRAATNAVVEA